MLFNSVPYILFFLPAVLVVYFILNGRGFITVAKLWLALSSIFFYAYWNFSYVFILIGSIVFNYSLGSILQSDRLSRKKAKSAMIFGLLVNFSLLFYYKYADFFITNLNSAAGTDFHLLHLILPLAISFFTFQQVAYLVDSYNKVLVESDFVNYCLFVTFFPQLIAGPIVHHSEMMPQFADLKNKFFSSKNFSLGLVIFSLGIFKKVFIADAFSVWANYGFDTAQTLAFFDAWGVSISYTLQLYFDFSGYTDMAVGSALMFNIKLPMNFNSPYKAVNIQDFWRRWHMTLSRWLRDYLYIPLGGSQKGLRRTYINLVLTFLLGGLWHGAGWTFILWGLMHGLGTAVHKFWQDRGFKMPLIMAKVVTLLFAHFAWVFFRATSFGDAYKVFKGMFDLSSIGVSQEFAKAANYMLGYGFFDGLSGYTFTSTFNTLVYIAVFGFVAVYMPNTNDIGDLTSYKGRFLFKNTRMYAYGAAILFAVAFMKLFMSSATEFLYFNF